MVKVIRGAHLSREHCVSIVMIRVSPLFFIGKKPKTSAVRRSALCGLFSVSMSSFETILTEHTILVPYVLTGGGVGNVCGGSGPCGNIVGGGGGVAVAIENTNSFARQGTDLEAEQRSECPGTGLSIFQRAFHKCLYKHSGAHAETDARVTSNCTANHEHQRAKRLKRVIRIQDIAVAGSCSTIACGSINPVASSV